MENADQYSPDVMLVHGLGSWKSRVAIRSLVFVLNCRPNKPKIHFFAPKWQTSETPQDKLQRMVDFWKRKKKPSVLVGISAGANPVRHLALKHPDEISTVHLFAGYTSDGTNIHQRHRDEAPAFAKVAAIVHKQLHTTHEDTSKIEQHLPTVDGEHSDDVIAREDMYIEGATISPIPTAGHSSSILWALVHRLPNIAS